MGDFVVRKPRPEDFGRIQEICNSIQPQLTEVALSQQKEDCFVAEIDGKVVGFVIGYCLSGSFGLEKSALLATVGVDPKFMGQKIGKQLAEKVLAYYKEQGYKSLHLSVRWDATDLLSFFKTLGFDQSEFINIEMNLTDNQS